MAAETTPGWEHLEAPSPADAGKYDQFLSKWGILLSMAAVPVLGFLILFTLQVLEVLW